VLFAKDIGDDKLSSTLEKELLASNTSSPTERLWGSIIGLDAVLAVMDERYSETVTNEAKEAIGQGREWIRRANGP